MVKFPQALTGLWPFKQAFNALTRRIQSEVEHLRVTNASGGDMVRGNVIILTAGQRQAALAFADSDSLLAEIAWVGVMAENTPNGERGISRINGYGYVLFEEGLTLDEGDVAYVSPVTAGVATNVEPSGGDFIQRIGIIGDISPYGDSNAAWVYLKRCCEPAERA
jgi:hypothetical protein